MRGTYFVMSLGPANPLSKVEPGGHLCLFYEKDPAEQMPALIPFIREGLTHDEQFIYIADDQTVDELAAHLERSGIDVAKETRSGRLKLYTRNEWRQPGELDSPEKLRQVRQFVVEAGKQGFKGIRLAVEMTWILGPDIDTRKLEHWEATLNKLFEPSFPTRVICQYNCTRLDPEALVAALHTHPQAILGQTVYPNPFFEAPLILHANGNDHAPSASERLPTSGNGKGKAARARLKWMLSQLQRTHEAEQNRVEAEVLRRTNEQLAHFAESAVTPLHWVGPDGRIQWANRAELDLLGCSKEEYIGRHIAEFHADPEVSADILRRLANREKLKDYPARLKTKSGALKHVLIDSCALWENDRFAHAQCFTRDITAEVAGQETRRFLAAVVECSDDAIITKNLDGIITSWNGGAERLFGYTAAEVIGKPVAILIPPDRPNEEPSILARLRGGQRIDHYETIRRRKDGSLINISLTVSPVRDANGRIIGASKTARDITERKRTECELQQAKEDFARANSELEKRVQERTASLREVVNQMEEFSYSVSHDLRSPVRAMKGYAQAVIEDYGDRLDAQGRDHLNRIVLGGSRMERLIHDVLTYSRLARSEIQLQPVPIQKLLLDIIQQYPEMQPPRAEITVRSPLHTVPAHEPSLTQAISNLLANGIKFVACGTTPKLRIWTEARDGKVRLWVEDNGIGIKPEHQHRIFGMFERVHPGNNYEGTGIGLAIVRKAAEKMGGEVGVESDGITGSSFWIELPAADHA
jgi:PAS domain S-box-containing protein